MQSFACITLDAWDLHFSRLKLEILFSCQLRTWESHLISVSFYRLDPFLFKWSLPLFKWWFFELSIRYRFLSLQNSFKCVLTSHLFWFKRQLSVLNMILESLTSFDSVFRHIARSTINSTSFDDSSEFKSLVPTCTMKWSGSSLIGGFL